MTKKFKKLILEKDTVFEESIEVETSIRCKENNCFSLRVEGNINAGNIDAGNITARNINAGNINAGNISFYAFCTSYLSIKCQSWTARRGNHHAPICLDGELIVEQKDGAK